MGNVHLGKNALRVIRLERDQTGRYNPVVIHEQETIKPLSLHLAGAISSN